MARTRIRRRRGMPRSRREVSATRRCSRARSCRTPTSSISTPPRASCSSSTSRPPRVIKHTNPCGAATEASAADAYVRAREADALAAFGGIVGLNRADRRRRRRRRSSRRSSKRSSRRPWTTTRARSLRRKANMRVVTADFARAGERRRTRAAVDPRRVLVAVARSRRRGVAAVAVRRAAAS